MIYLSKIKILRKKLLAAVRLLNKLLKLSSKTQVTDYDAYIENSIGRIYNESKHFIKSNNHLNKVLKNIRDNKMNDDLLTANTYKLIGMNYHFMGNKKMAERNLKISILHYKKIPKETNNWINETYKEIRSILEAIEH